MERPYLMYLNGKEVRILMKNILMIMMKFSECRKKKRKESLKRMLMRK